MKKMFYKKPGSNSRRFSSKPRGYEERERYAPRQTDRYRPSRYERDEHEYEDRYARSSDRRERSDKKVERKDSDEKKRIEKKSVGPSVCFKCGKEGHLYTLCLDGFGTKPYLQKYKVCLHICLSKFDFDDIKIFKQRLI